MLSKSYWGKTIAGGALALVLLSGCGEKEIAEIDWEREMRNFIDNDIDGQELFARDIYPDSSASFKLDESGDDYFYVIDNVTRTYGFNIDRNIDTILGFNDIIDAVVTIDDKYTGKVYRISGADTTQAYLLENRLQRYCYFLKLYGNGYQYHGWRFWGYSGLNYSIDGYFKGSEGDSIPATPYNIVQKPDAKLGSYFILKHDIARLGLGENLTFSSRFRERLFAEDAEEKMQAYNNLTPNGQRFEVSWQIPTASSRYYHLIVVDSDTASYNFRTRPLGGGAVESTMVKIGDYVIPYALDI